MCWIIRGETTRTLGVFMTLTLCFFRTILSILNTSNPWIVSVSLSEMFYMMTWKQVSPTESKDNVQQHKKTRKRSKGKKIVPVPKLEGEETRKSLGDVS